MGACGKGLDVLQDGWQELEHEQPGSLRSSLCGTWWCGVGWCLEGELDVCSLPPRLYAQAVGVPAAPLQLMTSL